MPVTNANSTIPKFTEADFRDPELFRFNTVLQDYFGRVVAIYQPGVKTTIGATLLAPAFMVNDQDVIPEDDNTLISLKTAKALFSPQNLRAAILTGAFQTGPTSVDQVQPTGGGSGSGVPGPPGPAGPAGPSGGGATVLDQTLSAGSTTTINPTSPSASGDLLFVFVKAKGTTAVLAWGSHVKWAPTELDTTTDTWTPFNFVGREDPNDSVLKWFYVGSQPVGGNT